MNDIGESDESPCGKLCKPLRDAIHIAQELRLSWVWIDSLCIMQGDTDAWNKEASRMSAVYGLSRLNIAATAAPDGDFGCLFQRNSDYIGCQAFGRVV